jgi:hypothetical protein
MGIQRNRFEIDLRDQQAWQEDLAPPQLLILIGPLAFPDGFRSPRRRSTADDFS